MRSRLASLTFAAVASVLTTAGLAIAQTSTATTPGFELLVPSGTLVPTGAQGDDISRGNLTAVQLSFGLRPNLVITSTVGWTRTTPRRLGPDARLHVFSYDAGVEYRLPRRASDRRVNLKPFTGVGLGARTHHYRDVDIATSSTLAAYASAGGELGMPKVRLRLEVRDYLTWGGSLGTGSRSGRNDVAVLAGLRLALR